MADITRTPVKMFLKRLYCCTKEMVYDGTRLATSPPQYPHKCKVCGAVVRAETIYPKLDYEVE